MTRRTVQRTSSAYKAGAGVAAKGLRFFVIISCIAAFGSVFDATRSNTPPTEIFAKQASQPAPSATSVPPATFAAPSATPTVPPAAPTAPPATSTAPPIPSPTPPPTAPPAPLATSPPTAPRVGIVAGHWGHDTGAICPDGLSEVDVNLDIAERVVAILEVLDYQTDLLQEFDQRLTNYEADALVSIHADSCDPIPDATPPASGFKVASVEQSLIPVTESRLVTCIAQGYSARTGMYFHENSITRDMTSYHTFYEVNGHTPSAIIEVGFLWSDRQILTQRPNLVAQGIADGIVCFIENERP